MSLVPRRMLIGYTGPACVLVVALVLCGARPAAAEPADDTPIDEAPPREPPFQATEATVYGRVFGEGADRGAGADQLDTLLRQKIAIIDRVCGLTDSQKERLKLAGRGDSARLFERVEKISSRIQLVTDDVEKMYQLLDEAHALQHDLVRPGLSSDGSLFSKSLDRLLTAEQAVKYAPLRAIIRAGGLVRIRRDREREMLEINLQKSRIADDELADVLALPGPHVLVLTKSQVTDAGLARLAGLTSLYSLSLNQTRVTDQGLAELKGLTELRELALDETPVTDAGLEHISGLGRLQHLSLTGTTVTDAGIAHLKRLTRLESLLLDGTKVTDGGLAQLKGLASLQMVLVRRTAVTKAGVAQLQRSLPLAAIHRE